MIDSRFGSDSGPMTVDEFRALLQDLQQNADSRHTGEDYAGVKIRMLSNGCWVDQDGTVVLVRAD